MPNLLKVGLITLVIVILGLVCVIGLAVGWVAWRQHKFASLEDSHNLGVQAGQMAQTYLKDRPRGALVIGIHQRGKDWVGGFGTTGGTPGAAPDGDSVFEIGSITKVFTGVVLARLVHDKVVALDDPISKHLPELAADGREKITLRQLATHTSGLPRLTGDFWQIATNRANPYAQYSAEQMYADVATVKLRRPPGTAYEYSNYGAALLGNLLANASGETYGELLERIVMRPLAMSDTAPTITPAMQARLVPGHSIRGETTPGWDFAGFAPAGALRSTANDMLRFIRFSLSPDETDLGRAVTLSTEVHSRISGEEVGLGWHRRKTVEELEFWWHNGGTGGYASFMAIDRKHQTGVIVIANSGDAMAGKFDVDRIGVDLMLKAARISLE